LITTIKQQARDLFAELKRVDWPTKDKVMKSTYAVVAVSLFFAAFFWATDWVLTRGVTLLFPHR
jgi:preprotein translocase subunit SecE